LTKYDKSQIMKQVKNTFCNFCRNVLKMFVLLSL